jgi:hypothetical protein
VSVRPAWLIVCDLGRTRRCARDYLSRQPTITTARAEAAADGWIARRARAGDPHPLGDGRRPVDVCPSCVEADR